MRHAIVVGLLVIVIAACGDSSTPYDEASLGDAQTLVDRALQVMADAPSYKASYVLKQPDDPEDARDSYHWEIEYRAPGSYRFLLFTPEGESGEVCNETRTADSFSRDCRSVMNTITGESVVEAIVIGNESYGRSCKGLDESCDRWAVGEREDVPTFGISTLFVPGWPLVAAELAEDLQVDADGRTVRGSVQFYRAVVENMHRLAEDAGWSDAEFEDYTGVSYEDASLVNESETGIEIELSSNHHVLRMQFAIPGSDPDTIIEYSGFGEITIEPPE